MLSEETFSQVAEFNRPESEHGRLADASMSTSALSYLDNLEPSVVPKPAMPAKLAFNVDFWRPEIEPAAPLWKNKFALACASIVAAGVLSFTLWQFNRAGFPVLKDLNISEGQELRAVALEDPAYAGTTGGIAVIPGNKKEARFYVASNAADGEELEVQLVGLRDTLVDSFYYSAGTRVKIKDHFAKTPVFHRDGGKPLSAGEYTVTVLKNGQHLAQKTVFLGGVKDADYLNGLKNYQDRLRVQAESELLEIRQVTDMLEKQFNETNQHFKSSAGWTRFHDQWLVLQNQIEILFKDMNSETLNREFYHGPLYGLLKEATAALGDVHAAQNESRLLGQPLAQKLTDAARVAQSRLLSLRAKIIQAERQSGM